jgi:hydroxymethylpyrimidine/phosphomethylpyrimidine kinase
MLFDLDTTRTVVNTLKAHYANTTMPPLVCDPVCVSTSGHTLLNPDAVEIVIGELFPLATLITPNKFEAELILSHRHLPSEIADLESILIASKNMLQLGPPAVLLKGGHVTVTLEDVNRLSRQHPGIRVVQDMFLRDNMEILQVGRNNLSAPQLVADMLYQDNGSTTLFVRPRIDSTNIHGTGCTLSSAIACELARGESCTCLTI